MRLLKQIILIQILFVSPTSIIAQQIAKTNDGRAVVLYDNGSWRYLEESSAQNSENNKEGEVYITKTGSKYHLDGCRWLKSRIPSTIKEASSKGLAPCKTCSPPSLKRSSSNKSLPSEYKPNSKVTSTRCQATTKKGTQCKRNSQTGRSYCWQHP